MENAKGRTVRKDNSGLFICWGTRFCAQTEVMSLTWVYWRETDREEQESFLQEHKPRAQPRVMFTALLFCVCVSVLPWHCCQSDVWHTLGADSSKTAAPWHPRLQRQWTNKLIRFTRLQETSLNPHQVRSTCSDCQVNLINNTFLTSLGDVDSLVLLENARFTFKKLKVEISTLDK